MKSRPKNNYSIRGISKLPLLIVVGVLMVILGGAFLLYRGSSSTEKGITPNSFQKVDGSAYTFYYPDGYVKNDTNDPLDYINPSSKAVTPEEIFMIVAPQAKLLSKPTYERCETIAETLRQKGDDEIIAEVAYGGFGEGKGVGCKYIFKSKVGNDINDAAVVVEKDLWYTEGQDTAVYRVRAVYFENAGQDEAKKLNLAIDQFTLK